jgi:urease accessory protein
MTTPRRVLGAVGLTLVAVSPARAHLMSTGFGPFYDGLTHLLVSPEVLLPVVALALLGGLHGPRVGRTVVFALPVAWLAGSLLGPLVVPHVTMPAVTAAGTVAVGGMVAAGQQLPPGVVGGLAVVVGLFAGTLGGIGIATAHASLLSVAGVIAALFVVLSLLAGQVASLRAPWARVMVQVAGSWIAAIGLLMLGWAVRGS